MSLALDGMVSPGRSVYRCPRCYFLVAHRRMCGTKCPLFDFDFPIVTVCDPMLEFVFRPLGFPITRDLEREWPMVI